MTSHKGYNELGPACSIGSIVHRAGDVVVTSFPRSFLPSKLYPLSYSRSFSARHAGVHPSTSVASLSIQTLRGQVVQLEIIKRRPFVFGATPGIRVDALYPRHYPPRKLGRDETAFLRPSLFLSSLPCFLSRFRSPPRAFPSFSSIVFELYDFDPPGLFAMTRGSHAGRDFEVIGNEGSGFCIGSSGNPLSLRKISFTSKGYLFQ